MTLPLHSNDTQPDFDRKKFSTGWVGAIAWWIFQSRRPLLVAFILITIGLGFSASRLSVSAGFTKMIPLKHPYMLTFLVYQKEFGGANKVLIAVKNR